jgi:short-subunit dehydrogenase
LSNQEYYRDKVVLITGASAGIGEEIALQMGRAGAKLTLAARRTERFEEIGAKILAGGGTTPLSLECDVTKEGDVENAVAQCVAHFGKLDIAVANAGFGVVGILAKLSIADFRRQFETNVFGVLRTLFATLPEIRKTRGQFAIMGSVAGWKATPGAAPYAMSKFALRALANAIEPELALSGVKVTLISPGFVESDIRRVDNKGRFHPDVKEPMPAWLVMGKEKAVRQMLNAIARGKREAVITGHGKLFVFLERFMPWVTRAMARKIAARGRGYRPEPT